MFKVKYNILVLIQIILSLLSSVLLLKIFGVSIQSDAYLLANSIIISIQGIQNLFTVQFLYFYNDEKIISKTSANKFYNAVLSFSLIIGIVSFFICYSVINKIINIFALNLDIERYNLVHSLLMYSFLNLIFYPVINVNEALLNAEMKFSVPYILSFIPNLCVVITLGFMLLFGNENIIYPVIVQAISSFCVGIAGTLYIVKKIIPFKLELWHKNMKKFIKNSIGIGVGFAFGGTLFNIILNNFLVSFSSGIISCYYYAKKIIDTCVSFSSGPSRNILRSNISKSIANTQYNKIIELIIKYIKLLSVVSVLVYTIAYIFIEPVIRLISKNITNEELNIIKILFLGLIPWSFLETIGAGFAQFNVGEKKNIYLYVANISFLLTIFLIIFLLKNEMGIYTIIYATFIAAIVCNATHFLLFWYLFNKRIKKYDKQ